MGKIEWKFLLVLWLLTLSANPAAAQLDTAILEWLPEGGYEYIALCAPSKIYSYKHYEAFTNLNSQWRGFHDSVPLPDELVRNAVAGFAAKRAGIKVVKSPRDPTKMTRALLDRIEFSNMFLSSNAAYFTHMSGKALFYGIRVKKVAETIKPYLESGTLLKMKRIIGRYPVYAVEPGDETGELARSYCIIARGGIIVVARELELLQEMHDAGTGAVPGFGVDEFFEDVRYAASFGGEWLRVNSFDRARLRALRQYVMDEGLPDKDEELFEKFWGDGKRSYTRARLVNLKDVYQNTFLKIYDDEAAAQAGQEWRREMIVIHEAAWRSATIEVDEIAKDHYLSGRAIVTQTIIDPVKYRKGWPIPEIIRKQEKK